MAVLRALVVLLALPMVVTLKLAAPMTRRQAIVATSATALPLVLQRTAAHADSLEEIAARSNAAAQVARDQKAAAAENQGLVEAAGCRRAILLRHFGEDPPATCGNCDNCLSPPAVIDATEAARKLLSAVYRTGQSYGIGHIEKVLLGAEDDRVRQRGHDQLSVFGIMRPGDAVLIRPLSRALLARGALSGTEHGGLCLDGDAREILRGERRIEMVVPPQKERARRGRSASAAPNPVDDPLFDALREARRTLAKEAGVPPYVIFHDSALRDMAARRPSTLSELGEIAGIGARKLETYGQAFLSVLERHRG